MAQSVGSVSVDVVPDASRFRRELDAKLKGIKANVGLTADVAKFRAQIEKATRVKAVTVNVDADTSLAEAQIDAVARDRKATIEVDADTAGATAQIAAVGGAASASGRGVRGLTVAVAALGPALVPVTAAVAGLGAALSAPIAAAGGGLTIWGLMSGIAAKQSGEMQKAVDAAKDKMAKAKKGTREYKDALQEYHAALRAMTPEQRKFQAALQGAFDGVKRLVQVSGPALLGPLTKAMNLFSKLTPRMKPVVDAVGGALNDLIGRVAKAAKGPGFKSFIDFFAKAAPPAIKGFAAIMTNIAVGVGGLVKAFAPLGESLMKSLIGLTGRFAKFGQTASSNKGVKGFIDYVRKSGPLVTQFFADLVTIGVELGKALAPIGIVILKAFQGLADVLKRTPTEVLTVISAGIMGIVTATWAWNIALRANPIGLVVGALVAFGAGLVLAYKKSETFRKIVNAAWRGIRKAAQTTWKWMSGTLWPGMKRVFGWIGDRAKWLWKNAIGPAFRAIKKFVQTELMPIIRRLWHGVFKPVFKGIGTVVKDAWNGVIKPVLKALWWYVKNVVAPVYKWLWKNVVAPAFKGIGKIIKFVWNNGVKPVLNSWISFFEDVLYPIIRKVYKVVKWAFGKVGGAAKAAWENGIKPALQPFMWFLDKLLDAIEKIKDGWEWVKDHAPKIGSADPGPNKAGSGPEEAQGGAGYSPYATGGYVTKPTRALIGEGREAEAILPHSVLSGLMGRAAATGVAASGARGGSGKLVAALWALVRELRRANTETTTTTKPSKDIGTAIHSGDNKGGTLHPVVKGGGNGSLHPVIKGPKFDPGGFESITTGFKKQIQVAQSWEQAVGKSAKKAGKFWTEVRYGPFRRFSDDWKKRLRIAGKNTNDWEKTLGKNARQSGRTLDGFRRSTLAPFARDFGNRFARQLPDDMGTFRSKTTTQFGKTSDSMRGTWSNRVKPMLRDFGSYPKASVAPAFAKGVDAIGGQWDKVRKATGKPVKFVVDTVLNKGLLAAFNKIAKFVDTDTIKNIELPKGFSRGGYTGDGGKFEPKGIVHGGEYVINKASTRKIEKTNPGFLERLNKTGFPGHAKGGYVDPDKRVYIDGEPIAAIAASQMGVAASKLGRGLHLMQGGWQPATSYSGTSHQYPGVADTSPGSFRDQYWLRRVGFASWARNIPGAHYAGSGAHVHSVSMLSPGTKASPQIAAFKAGGDGLGGSDYGDRPPLLPGLFKMLKQFGPLSVGGGGIGAPQLPSWAQKIVNNPKKWAKGLLSNKLKGGGFKGLGQGMLDMLVNPSAAWALKQLQSFGGGAAGAFGPGAAGVWKSLMSTGYYSKQQAAGVMGNMKYESGFVPNIVQGGGRSWNPASAGSAGYGLVQWTPGSKLLPYLNGRKPTIAAQVDALTAQLRGRGPSPESAAGAALRATRTPETAARVFGKEYERYAGSIQTGRETAARAIFERFGKGNFDMGGMADRMGFMPKWTPKPERVLSPRQTVAFDRMVEHNFNPSGQPTAIHITSGRLDITRDGKAAIRGMAAVELSAQTQHNRTVARQGI